ncbi:hypothetical protein FB382_003046 [Nocardioides ginsengisegetis]|uniref:CdiI immunity protein domain-containing protein n=1 Tax=Nocardioides ginsengisegetis TaxID=661491 RepID=A0A7W3J221_9ACTN|nr:hypothetical protein [Nocardioides ginsengisegetis]
MHTPALEHLVGAYFHQDWYTEHEDEWLTLRDFLEGEPHLAPLLPGEIKQLLIAMPSEADIEAHLSALGSCYTVDPGTTYRDWLVEVAARTEEYLVHG